MLWQVLLDSFAPQCCLFCDQSTGSNAAVCDYCEASLQRNAQACPRCALPDCAGQLCPSCQRKPGPLHAVFAPYVYDRSMAYFINRWKFQHQRSLAGTAAALMLRHKAAHMRPDLLLATPLHWRRQLWRGFNQSTDLLLALMNQGQGFGHARSIGVRLKRRRFAGAQAQLSRSERLQNLADAFEAVGDVRNRRITLVDDVCTTGATGEAMAVALLDAGAEQVQLWCFARTPAR